MASISPSWESVTALSGLLVIPMGRSASSVRATASSSPQTTSCRASHPTSASTPKEIVPIRLATTSTLCAKWRIVLPGHGEPFTDLAGRTAEIIQHHYDREAQILNLLKDRPQHAYDVAEQLFERRWSNSEARRMAVAETLSHLEHMRLNGQLGQRRTDDGLLLYYVL